MENGVGWPSRTHRPRPRMSHRRWIRGSAKTRKYLTHYHHTQLINLKKKEATIEILHTCTDMRAHTRTHIYMYACAHDPFPHHTPISRWRSILSRKYTSGCDFRLNAKWTNFTVVLPMNSITNLVPFNLSQLFPNGFLNLRLHININHDKTAATTSPRLNRKI